jgi:hypothetical protein
MENTGTAVDLLKKIDDLLLKDLSKNIEEHWLCSLEEDAHLRTRNMYTIKIPVQDLIGCDTNFYISQLEEILLRFYCPQSVLLREFFHFHSITDCKNNIDIINELEKPQDSFLVLYSSMSDYLKRLHEKGLKLFIDGKLNKLKPNHFLCSEVMPFKDRCKDFIDIDWQDPVILLTLKPSYSKPFVVKRAKPDIKRIDNFIIVKYNEMLKSNCFVTKYNLI